MKCFNIKVNKLKNMFFELLQKSRYLRKKIGINICLRSDLLIGLKKFFLNPVEYITNLAMSVLGWEDFTIKKNKFMDLINGLYG